MIKFVVALFVFAVALCAYIINAPTDRPKAALPQSPVAQIATEVSRGQMTSLSELPTSAEINAIVPDSDISETIERIQNDIAPETLISSGLVSSVENVLISLGLNLPPLVVSDMLEAATDDVVTNISAITGQDTAQRQAALTLTQMDALLATGLKARDNDATIDAQLNDAFAVGDIDAPAGALTTTGRIDTKAFLTAIVAGATVASGGAAPQTVDLWSSAKVITSGNSSIYIVAEGDSLAGIAVKLYGDIAMAEPLYAANKAALSGPDNLSASQELILPLR